jgi:SAM-dependent methyltransferase
MLSNYSRVQSFEDEMMLSKSKRMTDALVRQFLQATNPAHRFHSNHYLRHNARRLEHLASLRIPVAGKRVLEVGAGVGDHSGYFVDRGCEITITEARRENLQYLRRRYPDQKVEWLNLEQPVPIEGTPFDVVYCYGLLYHLNNPESALDYMSQHCKHLLLLETCVSFGNERAINPAKERQSDFTQAVSGCGCRPTRPWLFDKLQSAFEYVYVPVTQPNHEEFPIDWTAPEKHQAILSRAVFIASREPIQNEGLSAALLDRQERHP